MFIMQNTGVPWSSDQFYIVSYYTKWDTNSWTYYSTMIFGEGRGVALGVKSKVGDRKLGKGIICIKNEEKRLYC